MRKLPLITFTALPRNSHNASYWLSWKPCEARYKTLMAAPKDLYMKTGRGEKTACRCVAAGAETRLSIPSMEVWYWCSCWWQFKMRTNKSQREGEKNKTWNTEARGVPLKLYSRKHFVKRCHLYAQSLLHWSRGVNKTCPHPSSSIDSPLYKGQPWFTFTHLAYLNFRAGGKLRWV